VDPTPTPWRAIESGQPNGISAEDVASGAPARSRTAIAIFAVAALVAVASFLVAVATSGGGAIKVDGGSLAAPAASLDGRVPLGTSGGSDPIGDVVVEIVGAVARPGVFRLPTGARVGDLIAAAGGFGPRVDTTRTGSLRLAAVLQDGDQVRVPSRDDPETTAGPAPDGGTGSTGTASGTGASTLVDLNHAASAELEALPGIGPVTAGKIIASRESAGPFTAVEDLRTRKLVGEKTFEQVKSLVTVG
jgi:competence protein ComEA